MAKIKTTVKKTVETPEQIEKVEIVKAKRNETIVKVRIKKTYIGSYGCFVRGMVAELPKWLADEIGEEN